MYVQPRQRLTKDVPELRNTPSVVAPRPLQRSGREVVHQVSPMVPHGPTLVAQMVLMDG